MFDFQLITYIILEFLIKLSAVGLQFGQFLVLLNRGIEIAISHVTHTSPTLPVADWRLNNKQTLSNGD